MKEAIVEKLKDFVDQDTISERDVVYFLVEAHKLIERENLKTEFKTLVFYRHWAVHIKIDHNSEFREYLTGIFEGVHLPEKKIPVEVFSFVYFDLIAKDIIAFWNRFIAVREMKTTDRFFKLFRDSLLQILMDVPIYLVYGNEQVELSFADTGTLRIKGPTSHYGEIDAL
jgi:hypothetical protein